MSHETDRFNSDEQINWHPEAESQGRIARMNDYMDPYDSIANPYPSGGFMWKSFVAGWCDADQYLKSESM